MIKNDYPGYAAHKEQHIQFMVMFDEIKADYHESSATSPLVICLNKLISSWLREHIRRVDKEFAGYLASRGVFAEALDDGGTMTGRGSRMSNHTIEEFVAGRREREISPDAFELENPWMMEVDLKGMVWIKMGAMVAYTGKMHFEREGIMEQGLSKLVKRAVSGENITLSKAEGEGKLYLADNGKKVTILRLSGESLSVNSNDLLAFEPTISWDIRMIRKVAGMLAGGLFNITLTGEGLVAITTHHDPLVLEVTPETPVVTDPNATVAWSAGLQPEILTDVSLKTFIGRGSGESIQMRFQGHGFVVVQPFEETYMQGEGGYVGG